MEIVYVIVIIFIIKIRKNDEYIENNSFIKQYDANGGDDQMSIHVVLYHNERQRSFFDSKG